MFIRRDRRGADRFMVLRVALFFLAAGVWVGGLLAGNDTATGVAILIVLAALGVGLLARRRPRE